MKKYFTFLLILTALSKSLFAQCVTNYLINPSFESPIQPNLGNNFPTPVSSFNGWTIPSGAGFNVVKVNGSTYSGGPDNAHNGGNQYIDINSAGGFVQQSFTIACISSLNFSGWFSRRESGGTGFTNYIEILNSSNTVVATSSTVSFTSNEGQETWKQATGSAVNLPAGTYTFRFLVDDFANIDDAFLCVNPGCVLATKLIDFTASTNKCASKLTWLSSEETTLKQYNIEYSKDGISFITIGTVYPKAISTTNNYSFNYDEIVEGKVFFRLKTIEMDNKLSYSKIVSIYTNCNNDEVSIFPNPVADMLHINLVKTNESTAFLYNTNGTLISKHLIRKGDNSINIKALPNGVYLVKIIGETNMHVYRIAKI